MKNTIKKIVTLKLVMAALLVVSGVGLFSFTTVPVAAFSVVSAEPKESSLPELALGYIRDYYYGPGPEGNFLRRAQIHREYSEAEDYCLRAIPHFSQSHRILSTDSHFFE